MDNPLISVIVPVYRVEPYCRRCVESICDQTYQNMEIILVDDGSPDHCGTICDEYAAKDSRIKVIHKPNGGVSSARNAGLAAATGEYVVFCDGDDRLREIHLEEMLQWITLPGVDLAICGFESVDAAGKPILGRRSEDCSLDSAVQRLDHDLFWKLFREKRIGSCWDKIFRMECIRQHNLQFPVNVPLAEDTDFVLRYLEAAGESCTVAVTDARTYLYLTLEHDSAVQKPRPDQWYFFERLFPMLERHVSEDHHREAFREYLVSAVQFVVDGLLRYDSFLHYHQFRRYIADMLRSCYFREAVHAPNMKEYNRVLTAALKSGSAMAVWCFYLMCKAKFTLRRR